MVYLAIIALLGGSRYQIGGPTGAFVVVIFNVMQNYGYDGLAMTMLIANNVIRITKFSFVFFIFAPILVSLRLVYISVCRWWRTGWLSLHREAFYLSAPAPCPL